MKFRIIFILFFVLSCSPQISKINQNKLYSAKGFAYIYNDFDYREKIIKGSMSNDKMQISHQNLRTGTLIKIINPKNNETMVLKNIKRIKYPDFYKILITKPVAEKLNLDPNLPILENDTNNVIVFNDSFSEEINNDKLRSFWDLLKTE